MHRRPSLRVVSWNVLADAYVRADWFPFTDPALLLPGARVRAVLTQAARLDADVLALQEADTELAEAAKDALVGYDVRWCPKGRGRPDGCLTAVRPPWTVTSERALHYSDGSPASGHVAHIVNVEHADGSVVTVANTHLRFASDGTPSDSHIGVRQSVELAAALVSAERDVVAVRGARATSAGPGIALEPPLPGPACPSDHLPVVADLQL